VRTGTYPSKGIVQIIKGIEDSHKDHIAWARSLRSGKSLFTWKGNNAFCGCLYASMFSYAVQGRTQAIEQLDYNEFYEGWTNKKPIISTKFKTRSTYGQQVITFPEGICQKLTQAYLTCVRPAARQWIIDNGIQLPNRGNLTNCFLFVPHFDCLTM
jgi:hypothetical protein